jgi:hypothetical protein
MIAGTYWGQAIERTPPHHHRQNHGRGPHIPRPTRPSASSSESRPTGAPPATCSQSFREKDGRDAHPACRAGRRPVTAPVVLLRPAGDAATVAAGALAVLVRHLDRCKLAPRTVRPYRRQAAAYMTSFLRWCR